MFGNGWPLRAEKIRYLLLSEPNGFSFFINSDLNMIGKFIQSVKN
jgi:hypothetical protein